jgi:CheY-like chemotaxis protein
VTLSERWVLVVDDDADIRTMIGLILESTGVGVRYATDGLEALRALRGNGELPLFILLDLMMPVMNGWEFRDAQLKDELLAAVPVVIISGDGDAHAKAASLGAAGSLHKPLDLDSLIATVERFQRPGAEAEPHPPS